MKIKYYLLVILSFFIFQNCNSPFKKKNSFEINKQNVLSFPDKYNNNILQILQKDNYSCATTSVAMIITFYEELESNPLEKNIVWEISKNSIEKVLKYGNDISGLKNIAKYYGYQSEFMQNITYQELNFLLSNEIPVVIFINLGNETMTHALLLTGYDIKSKVYYIQDPSSDVKTMPIEFLDKYWNAWLSNPRTNSYRSGFIMIPKEYKIYTKSLRNYK